MPHEDTAGKAPLRFKTVNISDAHLGKGAAQPDMLLEFLTNVECETLILNGDILDGWHMQAKKCRKFKEMHLRVMDRINQMAANGTKVVYLPGNHDENLRAHWNRSKRKIQLPDPRKGRRSMIGRAYKPSDDVSADDKIGQTYVFRDHKTSKESRITFADFYVHTNPDETKILFLHGDQFDPRHLQTGFGKKLARLGDMGYDALIVINSLFIEKAKKHQDGRKPFSLSAYAKHYAKHKFGVIDAFEKAVINALKDSNLQGVACGHIHFPELRKTPDYFYLNSGDWVESCTAAVQGEDGEWKILDWNRERGKFGFNGRHLTKEDPNSAAEYRGITEKQMRWAFRLWPGRNYEKKKAVLDELREKVRKAENKVNKARARLEETRGDLDLYGEKVEAERRLAERQAAFKDARQELLPY